MPLLLAAVLLERDGEDVEVLAESCAGGSSCKTTAKDVVQACAEVTRPAFVIQQGIFAFSVLRGAFTYLVVSDAYDREVPSGFLERLRRAFEARYRAKATGLTDWKYNRLQRHRSGGGVQARFGPKLQAMLQESNARPDELSRLVQIQDKVEQVRTQTQVNLQHIMLRGERLSRLQRKTDDLEAEARCFAKRSKRARLEQWWASTLNRLVVLTGGSTAAAVAIAIPLIILL